MTRTAAVLLLGPLAWSCSAEAPERDRGRELFEQRPAHSSSLNGYSCSSCHAESSPGSRRMPGAALAGAVARPSFWGGQEGELLDAINACRSFFMYESTSLEASDADAVALYSFLDELTPRDERPVPFTVVRDVLDLPRGNAEAGKPLYEAACATCHGRMHDGAGALLARVPILPEETLAEHAEFSARVQRLVFIEKTRHGGFLGYGGAMPPFSVEVLSDAELADILEALGLFGG